MKLICKYWLTESNHGSTAVLPWESIYAWMSGDKEVKCFITDECCMCFFFGKSIIRKYCFPKLRIQRLLKKERLLKGVKYTLSRHFTMQCILLFTAYYSLATNYRNQSRSGCPAPSATGNSENFFTQKLSKESLHQRIRGTLCNDLLFKRLSDCVSQHSSQMALHYLIEITGAWTLDENGAPGLADIFQNIPESKWALWWNAYMHI